MTYPFSIARGRLTSDGKLVEGMLDETRRFIYRRQDDTHFNCVGAVDTDTVTFNTGLVDHDGTEIFTGDYLRHFADPLKARRLIKAEFIAEKGAFYLTHTEQQSLPQNGYGFTFERYVDRTDIVHERLDSLHAQQYIIVGNIYEGAAEYNPSRDPVFDHAD